jgi:hypothetical protein
MASVPYRSLRDLISLIDEPAAGGCQRLLKEHETRLERAAGATHNHQAWAGGYLDHLREVMNLAAVLYPVLDQLRSLPFSLSEALLVLFLHDLEKPWRNSSEAAAEAANGELQTLELHEEKQAFRLAVAERYGIALSSELVNALEFIEGEGSRYTSRHRQMGRLGSFCHVCDTLSARLWFDHPAIERDEWSPPRGS